MTTYKPHYACFECRKTFKRRLLKDVNRDEKESLQAKCPQCSNLMANMGLDFASPKKDDIKAWEHLRTLFTVGITFHSCGCSGPGYVPKNKEMLLEHLQGRKAEYIQHLQFWIHRQEPTTKKELDKENRESYWYKRPLPNGLEGKKGEVDNKAAIEYWNVKINELERQIENLAVK